jgi:SAM-dependent methyltransferase
MKKEWFAEWFDSPYYHILYKNHDELEAKLAVDNLLKALDLAPDARILDLACGKGRHSRYLAEKGFDVTGIDISYSSILYARKFELPHLAFYQHDMRKLFRTNYFDAVINMFTSFGYLESDQEHLNVIRNVYKELKPGGLFLLDFFNAAWVRSHLALSDLKIVDGIRFSLKRSVRGNHVYKTIHIDAVSRHINFREKVRLFTLEELNAMMQAAGLIVQQTFGSYALEPFDPATSKRLIMLASKPERV